MNAKERYKDVIKTYEKLGRALSVFGDSMGFNASEGLLEDLEPPGPPVGED